VGKNRDSRPISGFIAGCQRLNGATPSVIYTAAPDRGKLVTFIAGNKRHRLLFEGDGRRRVYDKKPQRYPEDNRTEFNCTHS